MKDFPRSLQRLGIRGGQMQRVQRKVLEVMGTINSGLEDPFQSLNLTKHGESRIPHCIKYDLGNGYRLITTQNNSCCVLCYVGNHDDCDRWIKKNQGLNITINKKGELEPIRKTTNIADPETRITDIPDFFPSFLLERLKDKYTNLLLEGVLPKDIGVLYSLNTMSTDDDILNAVSKIEDNQKAGLIFDTLIFLRAGDIEQAKSRIALEQGDNKLIDELNEQEFLEVKDGEHVRRIQIGSEEYIKWIKNFLSTSKYQDWMLFLHPDQQKIVDAEFNGPAKLSGVSGSGKTCIVIKRAIRLASKKPEKPVLILTLNKSLSALIQNLINHACPEIEIKEKIVVKSFFEFCQEYLFQFEPSNKNLYNDVTWKNDEHIDEVWREFYRCELNNNAAEVLFPIHKSLNSQSILPEKYLKQEFDWVRSAIHNGNREKRYIELERKGRAVPLPEEWRKMILEGLTGWEDKMEFVGVIDYLGLTTSLYRHIEKIAPEFSSVLVDEAQDFGTVELEIIRKLVEEGENDIFLCGDMAQHVLPKHHSFKDAGISIPGARSLTIQKNYRNSREILQAAYQVLYNNLDDEIITDSELEILDPKYANFSSPKPIILKADTLEDEIGFALSLLSERESESKNHKGCIAIVGYSLLEIQKYASRLNLPVLDGSLGLEYKNIFLSDLEQTKGYEFDTMCILNCNLNVLPSADIPEGERYRDACQFYVSMTRAKRELIISYSDELSHWLINCLDYFDTDDWSEYIDIESITRNDIPKKLRDIRGGVGNVLDFVGREFLYTSHAVGMNLPLQEKIDTLIDGQGRTRDRRPIAWKSIRSAFHDVSREPHSKQMFGKKTHKEFLECVNNILGNMS